VWEGSSVGTRFQSNDGRTFEAWLSEGVVAPVRMVVQRYPSSLQDRSGWRWTVWVPAAPWQAPTTDWHGTAMSRDVAETRAMAAAELLAAALGGVA